MMTLSNNNMLNNKTNNPNLVSYVLFVRLCRRMTLVALSCLLVFVLQLSSRTCSNQIHYYNGLLVEGFSIVRVRTRTASPIVGYNKNINNINNYRYVHYDTTTGRRNCNNKQRVNRLISLASSSSSKTNEEDDATTTTTTTRAKSAADIPKVLDEKQIDFMKGYLNKHHTDFIGALVEGFTVLGSELSKANSFSSGSMSIATAQISQIYNTTTIQVQVQVQTRYDKSNTPPDVRFYDINFNTQYPIQKERQRYYNIRNDVIADDTLRYPVDDIVRRLCRFAWIVKYPTVTGKLIQLAYQLKGAGIGILPDNLFLNQVPHNRYVREWFYNKAAIAVRDAVILCSEKKLSNRMRIISKFPETNPTMDSYRIGTLLELVRAVVIKLAEENLRVRVCVQGSMGAGIFTGIPKQLSGVAQILQAMDWQSQDGEMNAGMLGNYVRFGNIGKNHVFNEIQSVDENGNTVITQYQDDVFILIAPQSMVGVDSSIIPSLQEMTVAAGDRPIILLNPDLTDKVSSGGQQSIRGRQARIDFDNTFQSIFHFQNIYISGTSYFPILGAITKLHPTTEPWLAHQRRDFANGDEIYVPVLADEIMPSGESIMQAFER